MLTISASETLVSSDFADLSVNSIKNSIHDGDYDSHKVSVCVCLSYMQMMILMLRVKKNFKNRRKKV